MFGQELIDEIRKNCLVGRSGSCFNTADKWQAVMDARSQIKYVVANGAEGEPDTHKDYYILSHYADEVIKGIVLAMQTVGAMEGFLYLRESYHERLHKKLAPILRGLPIKMITETPGGYRCGEETVLLQVIEKKRSEPRFKPPFPTQKGLWGYPTLINNIETLYDVQMIDQGKYRKTRFYSINGAVKHPGTYEAPEDVSIQDLLILSDNEPKEKTFAQVGGGASGEIVLDNDYWSHKVTGAGSVSVHTPEEVPKKLLKWATFYQNESCGHCIPCREGSYRLHEQIIAKQINWEEVESLLETMEQTSFCALGRSVALPFRGLIKNFITKQKKEENA